MAVSSAEVKTTSNVIPKVKYVTFFKIYASFNDALSIPWYVTLKWNDGNGQGPILILQ